MEPCIQCSLFFFSTPLAAWTLWTRSCVVWSHIHQSLIETAHLRAQIVVRVVQGVHSCKESAEGSDELWPHGSIH